MAEIIAYSPDTAEEVGERLRRGEVGIFPCDTIYGLCGKNDEATADRLYEIKRRPQSKSFITLMDKASLTSSSLLVPDDLLSRWPAPFTAILSELDAEGRIIGTKAVRIPSDPYLQMILPISGPIFSTSVNFSGEKSLLTFSDIYPVFKDSVDFIVNAPEAGGGRASTLIDATSFPYKVLRQGDYII